jgi:glycosyltransferase involved in cell wall biosynthesis
VNQPLVSVLMTVYDAREFVGPAIHSICDQTMPDFEFVIVDDGSTDGSLAVIEECAANDARLRIISRPNTGIVRALNEGLQTVRGRYIARMDADDLCDSRRLEMQVRRMEQEPELVALGTSAIAIDPSGRRLGLAPVPLTHEEIEACHLCGTSSIYHPAVMMRRDALETVGGYRDLCPAEDFDLWLRLGEVGQLANLSQPLFIWRRTVSGLVARSTDRHQRALTRALTDAWKRRGLPGLPSICPSEFQARSDFYRQWGWMALQEQERSTGRHYAVKALLHDPLSFESWRLAACAIRGY